MHKDDQVTPKRTSPLIAFPSSFTLLILRRPSVLAVDYRDRMKDYVDIEIRPRRIELAFNANGADIVSETTVETIHDIYSGQTNHFTSI
ncbi:hypothetical protein KIN20_007046 [Parelaphostrongylus tenuis]|uniref:Uncharacterized protein n=1 Tax=Parelaphostrongylus tenuis TaxID=148309 RepID=A0AAD5M4P5_PARTN|nr:hypothetical protein KIN20_007046 [Parelaphostrongylus tenuis]